MRVTYSCAAGAGGSRFAVSVRGGGSAGAQKLAATSKETGAWNVFGTHPLGRISLAEAGEYELVVRPFAVPKWKVIGLQAVTLTPVR